MRAGDDSAAYSRRPEPARAAGTGTCPASAGDRTPPDDQFSFHTRPVRSSAVRQVSALARPDDRRSRTYAILSHIAVFGLVKFRPSPPSNARELCAPYRGRRTVAASAGR